MDDEINEYTLSTAWDVSTASAYVDAFSISGPKILHLNLLDLTFNNDGTKMFMLLDGQEMRQYRIYIKYSL